LAWRTFFHRVTAENNVAVLVRFDLVCHLQATPPTQTG
jgi:hypothetical protein